MHNKQLSEQYEEQIREHERKQKELENQVKAAVAAEKAKLEEEKAKIDKEAEDVRAQKMAVEKEQKKLAKVQREAYTAIQNEKNNVTSQLAELEKQKQILLQQQAGFSFGGGFHGAGIDENGEFNFSINDPKTDDEEM